MLTVSLSPRRVAPNHTLLWSSRTTLPMIEALGATYALDAIVGEASPNLYKAIHPIPELHRFRSHFERERPILRANVGRGARREHRKVMRLGLAGWNPVCSMGRSLPSGEASGRHEVTIPHNGGGPIVCIIDNHHDRHSGEHRLSAARM